MNFENDSDTIQKCSVGTSEVQFNILYIGNQDTLANCDVLRNQKVFACRSYREAAHYMQKQTSDFKLSLDVIIGHYTDEAFQKPTDFICFLNRDEKLSEVPFVFIETEEITKPRSHSCYLNGIDDIISDMISLEDFYRKISLIKKYKLLKKHEKANITTNNRIPPDRKFVYKIDTFFKRLIDILISGTTLIMISPILLIIAIIIKLDSKGPVFYTSYRAGSNYTIFKFIKFRTMVMEADHSLIQLMGKNQYGAAGKNGPTFFKISNDPRITRFGKFLRNTSLDELPQLFNVLKADMSLVGNRPLPLYEAKVLTTDRHAERFIAPAGITGLWQITKRGKKEMSAEERIKLDIDYARHNSFVQDLQIILKTPKALIQKDNV